MALTTTIYTYLRFAGQCRARDRGCEGLDETACAALTSCRFVRASGLGQCHARFLNFAPDNNTEKAIPFKVLLFLQMVYGRSLAGVIDGEGNGSGAATGVSNVVGISGSGGVG